MPKNQNKNTIQKVPALKIATDIVWEIETNQDIKQSLKHGNACIVDLDTMARRTREKTKDLPELVRKMNKFGYYLTRIENRRNVFDIIKIRRNKNV